HMKFRIYSALATLLAAAVLGAAFFSAHATTAGQMYAPISPSQSASSAPIGSVSLGNSTGKTLVMKTGSLAATTNPADQVILTYTVTAGKTFYLEYMDCNVRLTTYAATATDFGNVSLENPSGTKIYTTDLFNAGAASATLVQLTEPQAIAAASVIRWVV